MKLTPCGAPRSAQDINEAGQITGRVRDGATGEIFASVATPIEP